MTLRVNEDFKNFTVTFFFYGFFSVKGGVSIFFKKHSLLFGVFKTVMT